MCSARMQVLIAVLSTYSIFIYYTYLILMGNGWAGSRPGLMPNSRMFYGDMDMILAFLESKGHWSKFETDTPKK